MASQYKSKSTKFVKPHASLFNILIKSFNLKVQYCTSPFNYHTGFEFFTSKSSDDIPFGSAGTNTEWTFSGLVDPAFSIFPNHHCHPKSFVQYQNL